MIYLIYGLDKFLREQEISNIISKFDKDSLVRYDLEITLISDIILDASINSLFSNNKLIIVDNAYIFTGKKMNLEHDLKELESYISSPNPDTTLLFNLDADKIDERKKISKLIKENGKVVLCNTPKDLKIILKEMFKDYKIENTSLDLLINRVGKNLNILNREVEKIISYKNDELTISKEDILNVTSRYLQPDIFLLIDSLISKNIKKAFLLYNDLLLLNEEPIKIIIMLANQFRLVYQSKILISRGYDINYISSELDTHPYPIKLAIEKGRLYSEKLLLDYLEKLADLDYQIKSGQTDKYIGLELFILNI